MEIREAVEDVIKAIEERPDKNQLNIWDDLESGKMPRYSPLTIGRLSVPTSDESTAKSVPSPEEDLAARIEGILQPLELENPYTPMLTIPVWENTGFMAAGLGAKICVGNYTGGVSTHISPGMIDTLTVPEPEEEERFKHIKKTIERYVEITPDDFKISMPDIQGPYNIAYSLLGTEILLMMYDDPDRIHRLMESATEYYIRCYRWFKKHIPQARWVNYIGATKKISECAVNLISKELYKEFVAPYDFRLVEMWGGEVGIHTCSGPHVFEATLERFQDEIRYTECGVIKNACAGYLTVKQALEKIRGREIILAVGEELTRGREEETLKGHMECMKEHPLMIMGYTGMYYWTAKDDEQIRLLHKKMDDYYMKYIK